MKWKQLVASKKNQNRFKIKLEKKMVKFHLIYINKKIFEKLIKLKIDNMNFPVLIGSINRWSQLTV